MRWPGWVYESGEEPDYRFSLANERTFLAWIRTALALLAAGVAVDAVDLSIADSLQRALALVLMALGLISAGAAWLRWARAERAMRRGEPLPALSVAIVPAAVLIVIAVVTAVAVL